mmetsp:Transcript_17000/g.38261  ORF Transcript_17000/g.38261 Transcript_17000/m.38261 type:complete len:450 (-) Transcript_17000:102-1451(-)
MFRQEIYKSLSIITLMASSHSLGSFAKTTVDASMSISSISNSISIVGTAWVLSSAIFTTYSSTAFLKYRPPSNDNWINQKTVSSSSSVNRRKSYRHFPISAPLPRVGEMFRQTKNRFIPGSAMLSTSNNAIKVGLHQETVNADETKKMTVSDVVSLRSLNMSAATLLTLSRFAGSMIIGLSLPNPAHLAVKYRETSALVPRFIVPALFMFVANYSNSVALDRVGIPLTYTSKCGIPLVTVLILVLKHGMKVCPNVPILISLGVIAFGIASASWASPSFEIFGFGAAICSCVSQSALNFASKSAIASTNVSGVQAQRTMVTISTIFMVVLTLGSALLENMKMCINSNRTSSVANSDGISIPSNETQNTNFRRPLWLIGLAVVSYHVEYMLSFSFVRLVDPVTYGTCDAVRRLCIILMGRAMFGGDPFSKINKLGIMLSILGAIAFSFLNR